MYVLIFCKTHVGEGMCFFDRSSYFNLLPSGFRAENSVNVWSANAYTLFYHLNMSMEISKYPKWSKPSSYRDYRSVNLESNSWCSQFFQKRTTFTLEHLLFSKDALEEMKKVFNTKSRPQLVNLKMVFEGRHD